jgi:hypothetical protein
MSLGNGNPYDELFKSKKPVQQQPMLQNVSNLFGDAFHGRGTGFGSSKFDSELNWATDIDQNDIQNSLNEYRSEQQGLGYELSALGARATTKTIAEVAKLVGAVGGTITGTIENIEDLATGEDKHNFLEIAFNNRFNKTIENIHKNLNEEYLPVYVSESVEQGGFLNKIKSPEFWATEGADGLGFMLSMLVPGAAFKGLNLGEKALVSSAKVMNRLGFVKNLEKSVEAVAKLGGKTSSAIDNLNQVAITGLNTYFEAGTEAASAMNSVEEQKDSINNQFVNSQEFITSIEKNNASLNELLNNNLITLEEANQRAQEFQNQLIENNFQQIKGTVGRNVFFDNVGLLSLTNFRQTKMLFGNESMKYANKILAPTLKEKVKKGLLKTGESFLSEGGEELAQTSFESRNIQKAKENTLSKGYFDNVSEDLIESTAHLFKTLGTTEGQISAFLGGVLGRGSEYAMNKVYKTSEREQTENNRVYDLIQRTKEDVNNLSNLDLYETEEQINNLGKKEIVYKTDENGKRIFKPENLTKILKTIQSTSKDSIEFDNAIKEYNYDKIEELSNKAESNLIQGFITEEGVALDALEQHLTTLFDVNSTDENGKLVSNKTGLKRVNESIDHAKYLQKAFNTFNDFHSSLFKINDLNLSNEEIINYSNNLRSQYLNLKSLEYFQNKKLNEVNNKILDRINDIYEENKNLGLEEKYEPKFENVPILEKNQEVSLDDLRKNYKPKSDTLLTEFNKQKDDLIDNLKITQKALNLIWEPSHIEKEIKSDLEEKSEINEALNTKAKLHEEVLNSIKNVNSLEELYSLGKEITSKKIISPIINETYNNKKEELESFLEQQIEEESQTNLENSVNNELENDLNDIEDFDKDLNKELDVDEVPSELQEEFEEENFEAEEGKVVKVSNDVKNGTPLRFLDKVDQFKDFIKFARTPANKEGLPVTFQINNKIEGRDLENQAIDIFNDLKNKKLPLSKISSESLNSLENHLPLITNINFNNKNISSILETKLSTKENVGNIEMQNQIFIKESLPFRRELIKEIINNDYNLKNISTVIKKQLNDDLTFTNEETSLFNLQVIKTIKSNKDKLDYIKNNLFYVSKKRNLVKAINGEPDFNYKLVEGVGEIYLIIPNNNNAPFNLKLNTKRIPKDKAEVIYDLIKILSLKTESFKGVNIEKVLLKTIENQPEFDNIFNVLNAEIKLLKSEIKNPTIENLLKLLMYTSTKNGKTTIGRDDNNSGDWKFGSMLIGSSNPEDISTITVQDFKLDNRKEEIVRFIQLKRHNLLINDEVFNTNNDNYLKYLIDNQILNTNAIAFNSKDPINTATFQGKSKIYLDNTFSVLQKTKSIVKEKSPEIKIEAPVLFENVQPMVDPKTSAEMFSEETLDSIGGELKQILEAQESAPENLKGFFDKKIEELKLRKEKLTSKTKIVKDKETVFNVVEEQIKLFNESSIKNRVSLRKQYKDQMMQFDPHSVEIIDTIFNVKEGITNITEVTKILNLLYNTTLKDIKDNNNKKC